MADDLSLFRKSQIVVPVGGQTADLAETALNGTAKGVLDGVTLQMEGEAADILREQLKRLEGLEQSRDEDR